MTSEFNYGQMETQLIILPVARVCVCALRTKFTPAPSNQLSLENARSFDLRSWAKKFKPIASLVWARDHSHECIGDICHH